MARRSTRSSSRSSNGGGYGKSPAEARIERLTWGLLVAVFAILQLMRDTSFSLPTYFVPLAGAIILLGSGAYQHSRHWRVSPVTWIGGTLMAGFVFINLYMGSSRSFLGESLVVFALVILIGLFTGET